MLRQTLIKHPFYLPQSKTNVILSFSKAFFYNVTIKRKFFFTDKDAPIDFKKLVIILDK